ncbi:MAG: glycosyltransferase, partial [Deltaproteobacteria bacterium]
MVKTIQGPIKVLLIIHNPGITGPGNILLGTAKYLGPDFQVDVLCPEQGALPDRLTCLGVRVIPFDFSRINDPVYLFTLASRLRREGYHVFHIHSGQLTAFGKLLGVAARVPVIVMTEHVMSSDHHWIKNRLALWLHLLSHRVSNAISDRTIAVSEAARLAHIKRQGVDPASVVTIRNGIDLDEVPPCPAVPASAETVVGSAGRLSTEKGLDILIEAAAITVSRHPEARFLIAGEGPDRASLEARVRELKLEGRMGFPGFQGNMYPFLGECTIYVQPSRDMFESFGLTLVEAMASAKPVVVSDIAAFREIIEEGVTGLFFRPGDAKDLSGKIMLLLDDAKLREKLSCAAREAALLFDIRSTAEKTGGLYKTLLATKGFVLRDRWLDRAREELIAQVRREHDFDGDEVLARVRSEAARFLRFINGKRLTDRDASEYLEYADDFLIELFLQALERGPSVDPVARSNCRLLYRVLGARPV